VQHVLRASEVFSSVLVTHTIVSSVLAGECSPASTKETIEVRGNKATVLEKGPECVRI
jgi:hypothetical protein